MMIKIAAESTKDITDRSWKYWHWYAEVLSQMKSLPQPPHFSKLVPSTFFGLWAQKITDRKEIAETEAYFEAEDQSYCKNGIKIWKSQ